MKLKKYFLSVISAAILFFAGCKTAEERVVVLEKEDVKRVAVLVGEGFHDGEAYMPMGFLANRGIKVTVIGPERGEVKAYNSDFTIKIEKAVSEVSVDDFDALILPGGHAPSVLRDIDEVVAFARDFFKSGKPTAAICHGPQVLITAGVMEGKSCTAVGSVEDELVAAGANFLDQSVVVDGNLITSRVPRDLNDFSRAIFDAL
ncbi:type 1 glutamine amidotransferase domain-containing protein [Natronoflexus pectinivorans]|uniref:Protease I n=1 Tax=Natronoflexus pectinivorans TaxID=682526 RepID=A0A4R2GLD1_9BACT|nr:type 1 glutamine amidotransferase domain-containing protein [Natronoflexus pectinivorans]TCO09387.1 protease I [Natronoflexus pectinivorans]